MIIRRGSSSFTEASAPTARRRGRFQHVDPRTDQVDSEAIVDVDGSQQPVDLVAPVPDQIEEHDSDQVNDG